MALSEIPYPPPTDPVWRLYYGGLIDECIKPSSVGPTHTIYLEHDVFIMCFLGIIIIKQDGTGLQLGLLFVTSYLEIGERALVFHECAGHTIGSLISQVMFQKELTSIRLMLSVTGVIVDLNFSFTLSMLVLHTSLLRLCITQFTHHSVSCLHKLIM